jgi:hypothetical protein
MLISLDILISGKETALDRFAENCNLDLVISLFRTESLNIHTLLIKLVDILLKNPAISSKFEAMKGFYFLGDLQVENLLQISEELFGCLFSILVGIPAYRYGNESMTSYFLGQIEDSIVLANPTVLYSILSLVATEAIDTFLQHQVIKILHDLFLRNDKVKQQLLEQNFIKLLADLLTKEFKKKTDILDISNSEKLWKTEENVLSLLKAVALHGCIYESHTLYLEEILSVNNPWALLIISVLSIFSLCH